MVEWQIDWRCMLWLTFVNRLRFGRLFFGINMLTYVGYLFCLSSFIIITYPGKLDSVTGCPVKLTDADPAAVNSTTTRKVQYIVMLFYRNTSILTNNKLEHASVQVA